MEFDELAVKTDRRPTGTEEAFKYTEDRVEKVGHLIHQLEDRLSDVLRPPTVSQQAPSTLTAVDNAPTPLAGRIHGLGHQLSGGIERMLDVLERLDL